MKNLVLIIGIVVTFLVLVLTLWQIRNSDTPLPSSAAQQKEEEAEFVPGEVLVVFKENLPAGNDVLGLSASSTMSDPRLSRLKEKDIEFVEDIIKQPPPGFKTSFDTTARSNEIRKIYKLSMKKKEKADTLRLIEELKKDLAVSEVTPNYIRKAHFSPNDPLYSQQWAVNQSNNFDINAPEAWDIQRGSPSIVIAVIDTGYYFGHPDLISRNFVNGGETGTDAQSRNKQSNGVDDDSNGYVDDWRGYDMTTCGERTIFGTCTATKVPDNDPSDENGHGTHVSGIIAASGNNGTGIAGVNWNSKILPVKVFGKTGGGSCSDIMAALSYAGQFADIISMSLGSSSPCAGEDALFNLLHSQNIVVIASAGNRATSERNYPAASPYVISVASLTKSGTPSGFSNFGDWVDVIAPGSDILSAMIPGETDGCGDTDGDGYSLCSGTSMAAPYVSGVASLILSKTPTLSADAVFNILANSAKDIGSVGKDDRMGYGLVDAQKALTDMNTTTPPQVIISSPSDKSLTGRTLQIRGTVQTSGFIRYELAFASVSAPQNWQTTGITLTSPTTQVQDGTLGEWNLGSLSQGNYILRLTVITSLTSHSTTKQVIYDSTILGSWPKAIGRADIVVASDVNGDSGKELIVQAEDRIFLFSKEGNPYPGWPKIIPFENVEFTKTPVVGNLISNPSRPGKQIVYSVLHPDATYDLYVHYADGTLVSGWPQKGRSDSGVLGNFALSDMNGDGFDDVVYVSLTTDNKLQLIVRRGDGTILSGWENVIIDSAYTERIGAGSIPAVGNINSDSQKEIIVSNYEGTYPLGRAKVKAYASNGTRLWEHTIQANSGLLYDTYITLGDITGDGVMETIVLYGTQDLFFTQHMHLLVLNSQGQALSQFNSLDLRINDVYATLMLGDMNSDGKPEIIVSDEWEGKYTIISPEGNPLVGFPFTTANAIGAWNVIADVDGNGSMEVSYDALKFLPDETVDVFADLLTYNKTNGALTSFALFPKRFSTNGTPKNHVIADLDADGKAEYVSLVSASPSDFIYVSQIGLPSGKLEWPQYLHDEKHTNAYTKSGVLQGDANGDGVVDGVDFVAWLSHYNQNVSGGASVGDFNTNGKVDGIDFTIWLANYGKRI